MSFSNVCSPQGQKAITCLTEGGKTKKLETQRGRHHERCIQALNCSCRLARRNVACSRYRSYFRPHSHSLLTENPGLGTVYKPLNSPRGLLKFAEMSNSLGAGEFREPLQVPETGRGQRRAQRTPHTSRHGRRAGARTTCGCNATSDWSKVCGGYVKPAVIGRLRVGGAVHGISLI